MGKWSTFWLARRSVFALGFASVLAACTTVPPGPTAIPAAGAQTTGLTATGPGPDQFLGQPVARLDAALGTPDLVRDEGGTEFRRYDLGPCRAYAVVAANGRVSSLSTGPSIVGAPAMPFDQCTALAGR